MAFSWGTPGTWGVPLTWDQLFTVNASISAVPVVASSGITAPGITAVFLGGVVVSFKPFPLRPEAVEPVGELFISVRVSTPSGTWLDLNDHQSFTIAEGTFEEEQTSHRFQKVDNPFLEGEFVVNALRGNITESMSVYVTGQSHYDLASRVALLKSVFDQRTYLCQVTVANVTKSWSCYASDYMVSTTRPFLHAKRALFKVEMTRDPVESMAEEV